MKKILFVSFKKYNTILEGGGIANQRNVRVAESIFGKQNVGCFYVNDEDKQNSFWEKIRSVLLFPFGYFRGLTPSKVTALLQIARGYEMVFVNTSVLGIVAKALKHAGYQGKVVVFFHNVESEFYEARVPKKLPFRNIIIRCAYVNDKYSLKHSDISIALNTRDNEKLLAIYGHRADYIVPITFADKCAGIVSDHTALTRERPLCLFVGSNFPANAEGVLWFVRNVLPYVNIEFKIVGKGMKRLKESHKCLAQIDVVSDVPDLAPYFESADFMILPIFSGSGMKVKTCESLMYGKNIIGTNETFEGYDVDTGKCGRCCNTAEEYIEALKRFSEHPVPRFNSYSRMVFETKYSDESAIKEFKNILL